MERLALIEVLDQDGRVQHVVGVTAWPVSVGRAIDCDVVLQDPHVAAHHADFGPAQDSAQLVLTVGASVNGAQVEAGRMQRRLAAGSSMPVPAGAICHFGRSALRVRLAGEVLAPEERLDHPSGRTRSWLTVGALGALMLWIMVAVWLQNEPDSGWDKYLPLLMGALFGVAGWSALWGLGSKLFQRQFRIVPHLRVLLAFALASLVVDALLAIAAFSLSWAWLSHLRGWIQICIFGALLATHVSILLPGRGLRIAIAFGSLCAVIIGIDGALSWRHSQRVFGELYASTLPPPGFRVARAGKTSELIDELKPLQARLDRQAREDEERDELVGP